MRSIDLFKLSTRMFKARTSRTLLTVLGMSVGISAILFLVSLGNGLQKTLLERITTAESLLTLDIAEAKAGLISLNKEVVEKISKIAGVVEVSPAIQMTSQGSFDELSADIVVMAIRPSFFRLGGMKIEKGEIISDNKKEDIVITRAIAEVFGKNPEEMIGKEITFTFLISRGISGEGEEIEFERIENGKKYKISGIMDGDENMAYLNSATLDDLKIEKYSQLKVKCASSESMGGVRDQILGLGLLASSLSDVVEQANQIFRVIQIILMLFGIVALVVSAIGMFNTMTITLLERTEEIGIMKSIGASDGSISLMFIMESAIMGFLGGVGGVILGIVGGEGFNMLINAIAKKFGGEVVDLFSSPPWFVAAIVIFGGFVGFLTGIIPARRASKIDPLDALRYK